MELVVLISTAALLISAVALAPGQKRCMPFPAK